MHYVFVNKGGVIFIWIALNVFLA
uniref:ABC transporter permease n=1 Tax=Heterorhabditis bacteriophora TaxID=37862 RepID=A0A1I7X0A8_HETBA